VADKFDRIVVGGRIKALRAAQGLTVQELAHRSKVSAGYLSEVERGLSAVSVDKLMQISEALGIALDSLLSEKPNDALEQEVVRIPSALSLAAEQLNLSYKATLSLLQGKTSLMARRSETESDDWQVEHWVKFYEKVKHYLPEC
jgi:transcriptional regulator with XRE-family HTH domain